MGFKGQSINIPVPFQTICTDLPREGNAGPHIQVYSSKHKEFFEVVNVNNTDKSLEWLQENNCLYANIDKSVFMKKIKSG